MSKDSLDYQISKEMRKEEIYRTYADYLDKEIQFIDLDIINQIFGLKRVRVSENQVFIQHSGNWWPSSKMYIRGAIESML